MNNENIFTREVNGLLFVGDPHLSSNKPGKRKDEDFAQTILDKIEFIVDYANEKKLQIIFLGDMFDRSFEPDEKLKTKLMRILKKCYYQPIANVGNHDKKDSVLGDEDTLSLFGECGLLFLCKHSGPVCEFLINGKKFGFGATPYGFNIPTNVSDYFDKDVFGNIIWITHHDIAFEGAYPGSIEPYEINGCILVVNGHMHFKKNSIRVGRTNWYNPGNITRWAIDAINHEPSVLTITPSEGLKHISIPHKKGVFNLIGQIINNVSPGEANFQQNVDNKESAFVNLLKTDSSFEVDKTSDGSFLLEEILEKFNKNKTEEVVKNLILDLHKMAVEKYVK